MIGRVVGNYEIVERLGEGGMGTVWRAVDVMLDREVAIKAIRPDLAAEPQIVDRFRSEAKILARVHHPAVATIYSFFRDGGELYLAMELVRGKTLSQVLREEGALPWPRAAALATAALEGLEQVHRTGILHRDLKPDNLMLTEAGDIKVMDFGIARAIGTDRLTRTGLMVGTLRYMSPEQLRGQEVDSRSDLYSLGIVLYEMLTGRVPFPGGSEYEAIRAQVEDPPAPPASLVPGLPLWLDRIVLRALAKFPLQRFESAAAMATSLAAGGRGLAGEAAMPTVAKAAHPTPPPSPVNPVAPIAAAENRPPTPTAASSYRAIGLGRSRGWLAGIAGAVVLLLALVAGITWTRHERSVPPPAAQAAITQPTSATVAPPVPAAAPSPQVVPTPPTEAPATAPPLSPPAESAPPAKSVVRRTPPSPVPAAPRDETVASSPPPAAAEPSPPPAHDEPVEAPSGAAGPDASAMTELAQLGDQLGDAGGRLADAWSDFRSQKKDRGEAATETDDKIKDEIDVLRDAATRFNRRVNASALRRATWRLKREGEAERRAQVVERVREIDETLKRLQHLLGPARPSEAVLAVWQEIRQTARRINALCNRA